MRWPGSDARQSSVQRGRTSLAGRGSSHRQSRRWRAALLPGYPEPAAALGRTGARRAQAGCDDGAAPGAGAGRRRAARARAGGRPPIRRSAGPERRRGLARHRRAGRRPAAAGTARRGSAAPAAGAVCSTSGSSARTPSIASRTWPRSRSSSVPGRQAGAAHAEVDERDDLLEQDLLDADLLDLRLVGGAQLLLGRCSVRSSRLPCRVSATRRAAASASTPEVRLPGLGLHRGVDLVQAHARSRASAAGAGRR